MPLHPSSSIPCLSLSSLLSLSLYLAIQNSSITVIHLFFNRNSEQARFRVSGLNVARFLSPTAIGEIYLVRGAGARFSAVSLSCVPKIFIGSLSSLRSPLFPGSDLAAKKKKKTPPPAVTLPNETDRRRRTNRFESPTPESLVPRIFTGCKRGVRSRPLSRKGPQPSGAIGQTTRVVVALANEEIDSNRLFAYHRALAFTRRPPYPGMRGEQRIYRFIISQEFTHVTRTSPLIPESESMP